DNILFLDYDGVVALDFSMELFRSIFDRHCIENVNKLCHEFDLKIVVTSSWRNEEDYKDMLYDNGLDTDIEIIGKTPELYIVREDEIKIYLREHVYIDKFIILDDTGFTELKPYHVQTSFVDGGFNDEKYEEARQLLINQKGNRYKRG
ncbi:MAG: hypothetical protein IJJ19_07700, partial [Erysipelotrichaceae bacterium]|nr:hypothetical protein [Erysipelotrichaceae bacterium]